MAKAAVVEPSSSNSFPFGRGQSDVKMKRKTPSELRGEQLKRRNAEVHANEQLAPLLAADKIGFKGTSDTNKPLPKVPKYITTRVNEVYPVKKSSERCRALYEKERVKDTSIISKASNSRTDPSIASTFPLGGDSRLACNKVENFNIREVHFDQSNKEAGEQIFRKIEKCSQSALRNVVELHLGNEGSSDSAGVDMQKALKGLVARNVPATSGSSADSSGKHGDLPSVSSRSFSSGIHIHGQRSLMDFTLKTSLRLVSSSSVKWCHKLSASPATVDHLSLLFNGTKEHNSANTSGTSLSADSKYTKALCSWMYPQSSLPASLISAMSLSVAKAEKDFLSKRQQDWEDSFGSLYYMLRQRMCNIFYVYTTQFIVLFIGGNISGKKHSCNAYLSQSTRGLRSLLKKYDVCFSMPLGCAEAEQAAEDDLVELSEIEKQNLGQTVQNDSTSDADNSPQSLLAFIGNKNAHSLYDFLLNYRFFLNSFTGVDVPVLYAPVPFRNASLSVPEVRCREMKRANALVPCSTVLGTDGVESSIASFDSAICYSIEIKDTVIPPWIVSGICGAMSSDGRSFEASFTTDPSSIGLNVALDSICQKTDQSADTADSLPEDGDCLGIPEMTPSPHLRAASLTSLKYSNGSYVASVTPI